MDKIDLTAMLDKLEEAGRRVNRGDLSHAEAILTAQAVTLNTLFATLACNASQTKVRDATGRPEPT